MGSPMVFQTAPPHPASNARMTCSPQFVGGADASQKGFGHLIPANVVSSVGLGLDIVVLQPCCDADACAFAVSNGVDDLAASVGAVASCEILWIRGLTCSTVDHDAPALKLKFCAVIVICKKCGVASLPDRENNKIDGQCVL